jgi:hypothetical protein
MYQAESLDENKLLVAKQNVAIKWAFSRQTAGQQAHAKVV